MADIELGCARGVSMRSGRAEPGSPFENEPAPRNLEM